MGTCEHLKTRSRGQSWPRAPRQGKLHFDLNVLSKSDGNDGMWFSSGAGLEEDKWLIKGEGTATENNSETFHSKCRNG